MSDAMPRVGRLAGIDYGSVRVGVAVTDPEQRLASPLQIYARRDAAADSTWLGRLVREETIVGFVVGLPVHTSGQESQKSKEARDYGGWIAKETGLPVRFFDERYTSVHAEELLLAADLTRKRRKERIDKLAAQILLTAYLQSGREEEEAGAL